ncbi:acyltransferase [Sphingomonas sp. RB3P16]|uniref:acyltransferase family protein n=1 Tax=Parasphingomonas frigoris TaxID=3096163 RepID=UPI002FC7DA6D
MTTIPPAGTRQTIHSLTGLRGVAAAAVVLHHCWRWSLADRTATGGIPGQWAVDLFFVLSGFVLALSYLSRPINWRKFAVARFARIYPLHIVTALAMALILVIQWKLGGSPRDPSLTIGQGIREFSMLTAMPIVGRNLFWNSPSWSISVEVWTYILLFPIIVAASRRVRVPWIILTVSVLLVGLTVALYILPLSVPPHRGWLALARAMIEFAGGWAAYLIWKSSKNPMRGWRTDALALATVATLCSVPVTHIEPWILIPLFPLLVAGLATGRSISAAALSGPRLVYLGDISFSVYLMHMLVIEALRPILGRFGLEYSFVALVLTVMPITFAVSTLTYRFLEKPSRDKIRLWLDPKDKPEPPDTAASF